MECATEIELGGKMLRILRCMYISVRSCVQCPDSLADFFKSFFFNVLMGLGKDMCFSRHCFLFCFDKRISSGESPK